MTSSPDDPKLWVKLDFGPRGQVGPGKIALLKAIREHDSIAAAARAMGMSYRRAWLLVDELNATFGRPVVATHVGGARRGGAELTEIGRDLIAGYERLLAHATDGSDSDLSRIASMIGAADES